MITRTDWFQTTAMPLRDLLLIERQRRDDKRGFLSRFFCSRDFVEFGFVEAVAQINHTSTRTRGTVRGLHYQTPPDAEIKLVSCLRGSVWDVAVDLRTGSPTFLRWHAEILSADNLRSLLIPQGFAHGFQALTDDCELIYLHSCAYAAKSEGAVNVADPAVAVDWPLPVANLSPRDQGHPMLTATFTGIC